MSDTYTVVYATGGRENAEWHRAAACGSLAEAENLRDDIVRGGRPAHLMEAIALDLFGLPKGPAPLWDYTNLRWKV